MRALAGKAWSPTWPELSSCGREVTTGHRAPQLQASGAWESWVPAVKGVGGATPEQRPNPRAASWSAAEDRPLWVEHSGEVCVSRWPVCS